MNVPHNRKLEILQWIEKAENDFLLVFFAAGENCAPSRSTKDNIFSSSKVRFLRWNR